MKQLIRFCVIGMVGFAPLGSFQRSATAQEHLDTIYTSPPLSYPFNWPGPAQQGVDWYGGTFYTSSGWIQPPFPFNNKLSKYGAQWNFIDDRGPFASLPRHFGDLSASQEYLFVPMSHYDGSGDGAPYEIGVFDRSDLTHEFSYSLDTLDAVYQFEDVAGVDYYEGDGSLFIVDYRDSTSANTRILHVNFSMQVLEEFEISTRKANGIERYGSYFYVTSSDAPANIGAIHVYDYAQLSQSGVNAPIATYTYDVSGVDGKVLEHAEGLTFRDGIGGTELWVCVANGRMVRHIQTPILPPDGPQQGNYLSLGGIQWIEGSGDGDQIPECGEDAYVQIDLCASSAVTNIFGTLSSPTGECVEIYDAEQQWPSISGGACEPSFGTGFSMNLSDCVISCYTYFTLSVEYSQSGVEYQQTFYFSYPFPQDGLFDPILERCSTDINVDIDCNDDGILNSGEHGEITILLRNTGGATAIQPDVWLSCVAGIELDCGEDIRYTDIPHDGSCHGPEDPDRHFDVYVPKNVSGWFFADILAIWAGADEVFSIPDGLQFYVEPQGWIRVYPQTHDFGVTGTDEDVVLLVSIDNQGSAPMEVPVDGIVPSHPDTSWSGPSLPWTIDPGSSQEITVTIETEKMGCEQIVRWIDVISDACVDDPDEDDRVVITGMVCDAWPVFELPATTAVGTTNGMDVSGTLMVWQDDRNPPPGHDIYAFDIPTGEEFEAVVAPGHQSTARISGSLFAWNDDSDGDLEFDVWARFLPDGDPFPVANSTMDERLVGVSGNLIAFSRVYYEFPPNGNEPDPRNMYVYDASTGETEALTSCFHDGFNPMCTVSLPGDFGGCLLVWDQLMLVWDGDNWKQQDRKLVIYDVCQGVERDQILGSTYSASTNDDKVVWCATDAGNDDQVYLWQNGVVTQITSEEVDHEFAEVGDDLIVYRKFLPGLDAIVYWDLSTGQEVLIMLTDKPDERWRMDGNVLALRLYGPPRLYYAFLNEADISVNPEGISFSTEEPYEGELFDVTVAVNNIAPLGTTEDITVELYDGHPDDGELLDSKPIFGGMDGQSQVPVTFPMVELFEPRIHDICVRVVVPSGDNPANNIACKVLEVLAPGACCFQDGTCDEATTPDQCAAAGGIYQDDGSSCPPDGCPVTVGACCLADGICIDGLKAQECAAAAGTYQGNGSVCAKVECDDPDPCPWDLDGNNDVGVKDLLVLLGAWGPCPPKGGCPADFDGSGDVGVKDLLILLGVWGPCT